MGYEWDIFLSYPRRDPIGPWVQDHFAPVLKKWLGAALPQAPAIFLDKGMETGSHWPSNLQYSLHRARYMIAVWAPPYFGSAWCLAEWESMRAREAIVGLPVGNKPGLVYPVCFFDGANFPAEAQQLQSADSDFRDFNAFPPGRIGLRSKGYRLFEAKVKALAETLAERLAKVPAWQSDWPCIVPPAPPTPPTPPSISYQQVTLR